MGKNHLVSFGNIPMWLFLAIIVSACCFCNSKVTEPDPSTGSAVVSVLLCHVLGDTILYPVRLLPEHMLVRTFIQSVPLLSESSVLLNGAASDTEYQLLGSQFGGYATGSDSWFYGWFRSGLPFTVTVTTDSGVCQGTVILPDTIIFASPSLGSRFYVGDSIEVKWRSGADFYWVSISYNAKDSADRMFSIALAESIGVGNSAITETTIIIPGRLVTHPGDLFVGVAGYNGPLPAVGNNGNMTGDLNGYLYSFTSNDNSGFDASKQLHMYIDSVGLSKARRRVCVPADHKALRQENASVWPRWLNGVQTSPGSSTEF